MHEQIICNANITLILHLIVAGSSNLKTDYYFRYFNNSNLSVIIMTTESQPVEYLFETNNSHVNGTVVYNNEFNYVVPQSLRITGTGGYRGIYLVVGSDEVTVIGQNLRDDKGDTFQLLPIKSLCRNDYVYYGISVPSSNFGSFITIVGTEVNTSLTVTSRQSFAIREGNINFTAGIPRQFKIERFQTRFIRMSGDLTGTKIVTDKPVSVLSGHQCARVPANFRGCDHLIEQVPPTTLWGKVYYTAPLATRSSYTIKVLAAYNSTVVDIYCNNTSMSCSISEGESFNKTQSQKEFCVIISNKKVLVVQLSHGHNDDNPPYGGPMMTLVPAREQYSDKFQFSTLQSQPGYRHFINIIVLRQFYQPDMIYLISGGEINRTLNTYQWVPIMVNNGTEAYGVQVNVSEGVAEIVHVNNSAKMSAIAYGFTTSSGYGHPIGNYRFKGN